MEEVLAALEERVATAAGLLVRLRDEVRRLEAELAGKSVAPPTIDAGSETELRTLRDEVARLQGERSTILERVRILIREIDQVAS